MNEIRIQGPAELMAELGETSVEPRWDGPTRGPAVAEVIVQLGDAALTTATVVGAVDALAKLARALRSWVQRRPPGENGYAIVVRRPDGTEITIAIPPNVQTETLTNDLVAAINKRDNAETSPER